MSFVKRSKPFSKATRWLSPWELEFGVSLDFGVWILVFGFWCLDFGVWSLVFGFWILVFGISSPLKAGYEPWSGVGAGAVLSRYARR